MAPLLVVYCRIAGIGYLKTLINVNIWGERSIQRVPRGGLIFKRAMEGRRKWKKGREGRGGGGVESLHCATSKAQIAEKV